MELIEVVALKGTRRILVALTHKEKMNFSELARIVGFSTTTTRSLKAMEAHLLVTKEVLNEPYRPVAYSLTDRGKRVANLLAELDKI